MEEQWGRMTRADYDKLGWTWEKFRLGVEDQLLRDWTRPVEGEGSLEEQRSCWAFAGLGMFNVRRHVEEYLQGQKLTPEQDDFLKHLQSEEAYCRHKLIELEDGRPKADKKLPFEESIETYFGACDYYQKPDPTPEELEAYSQEDDERKWRYRLYENREWLVNAWLKAEKSMSYWNKRLEKVTPAQQDEWRKYNEKSTLWLNRWQRLKELEERIEDSTRQLPLEQDLPAEPERADLAALAVRQLIASETELPPGRKTPTVRDRQKGDGD